MLFSVFRHVLVVPNLNWVNCLIFWILTVSDVLDADSDTNYFNEGETMHCYKETKRNR